MYPPNHLNPVGLQHSYIAEYLGRLILTFVFPISRNSDLTGLRWDPGIGTKKKKKKKA